jgi:hypothetical protein
MVDGKGNFPTEGFKIQGGDGGWTAMSHLNQKVLISTTYYAGMQVTPDYGKTAFYAEQFFSKRMLNFGTPGEDFAASFVTPMLLWESTNDLNSPDSLYHLVKEPAAAGSKVMIRSAINKYPFYYTTPVALSADDTIRVQDIVQARFFLAGNRNIWMTRQIHEFGKELEWYNLANLPHTNATVQTIALSKDGNHLFAGTTNGRLYRISNINNAIDSVTGDAGDAGNLNTNSVLELTQLNGLSVGSRNVTSIAVDPKNNDRIIVTVGIMVQPLMFITLPMPPLPILLSFPSKAICLQCRFIPALSK